MRPYVPHILLLTTSLLGSLACGSFDKLPTLGPSSPYDAYARSLAETAALSSAAENSIAGDWLSAGDSALDQPVAFDLPFREALHFDPRRVKAVAYELELRRGQQLAAEVEVPEGYGAPCFLDLFLVSEAGEASRRNPKRVAQAKKNSTYLRFSVQRSGTYVLRLQPAMAAQGLYTLDVVNEASLTFPVAGHGPNAVASVFGDPRSGGRRHDGIDIFAPRGTDAVAARDGRVTRVGTNRLGGNVVWMRGGGLSFYYAHLEDQSVTTGEAVKAGDTLGRVGNSGNAVTTPPHLHFGIYDGGAIDPLPYLTSSRAPSPVEVDMDRLGDWGRVRGSQVNFRQGPSTGTAVLDKLPLGTAVSLHGGHRNWYRAELPDGRDGYLFASLIEGTGKALRRLTIDRHGRPLHYLPEPTATVVTTLPPGHQVAVLGSFEDYLLVRHDENLAGWIPEKPVPSPAAPLADAVP